MKLHLIATSLLCATLYSAEEQTPDAGKISYGKILSDLLAKTDNMDQARSKEMRADTTKYSSQEIAKRLVDSAMRWNNPVDPKTIAMADTETATLAREHNQKLIAQSSRNQQPK